MTKMMKPISESRALAAAVAAAKAAGQIMRAKVIGHGRAKQRDKEIQDWDHRQK